jgi:predicted esterase
MNIEQLNIPFYIGHGLKDRIVPVKHSILFNESLGAKQDGCIFHIDSTASHNYSYWNSEVDNVIDFFKSN